MRYDMQIELIKTVAGRFRIVDAGDNGAPLVTFHNEFDNELIANTIFESILDRLAYKDSQEGEEIDIVVTRFDLMEMDE